MESGLTFKPGIKNVVPEDEKFHISFDLIKEISDSFDRDTKKFDTEFVQSPSKSSVEYRPGVRKFTSKELDRILGGIKKTNSIKRPGDSEEMFSHYIDNHCMPSNDMVDKDIIKKRRKLPVQLMGLEKAIDSEKWFDSTDDFVRIIHGLYEDNTISESYDGRIIHEYNIPIGYYTDYDGGYSTIKGKLNYRIFEDIEEELPKERTIIVTTAAENGIEYIETFCGEDIGLIINTKDSGNELIRNNEMPLIQWVTSRFFSFVFKSGFTIYDSYYDYKYRHPSSDTYSYMRMTLIPGGR